MARIILHVGTHKTGTTGLQRSLFEQREVLEQLGISYDPWPGVLWGLKYAHHGLAHRLARYEEEDRKVLDQYRMRVVEALERGLDIIISAEPFYRQVAAGMPDAPEAARILFLDRAADYFRGLPVEVSICFRRPDCMAESMFKEQAVSTGNQLEFEPWLDKFARRFQYAERLAEFEDRFGAATVWCFEDAVTNGLLSAFLGVHQLQIPKLLADEKVDRKSVSSRSAMWLLRSKQYADGMSPSDRKTRWYYAASEHRHPLLVSRGEDSFWASAEFRDRFLRNALVGFRCQHFWGLPKRVGEPVVWSPQSQSEVEAHFEQWVRANPVLLKMRESANLAPYDGDDRIPFRIRLGFLHQQIWACLFGEKSD